MTDNTDPKDIDHEEKRACNDYKRMRHTTLYYVNTNGAAPIIPKSEWQEAQAQFNGA